MKWIKIFSVWLCIIPVAILNGGFREYFLENYLSEKASLSVSGIILSVLIFFITSVLLMRIKEISYRDSIITGLFWTVLTIGFEFSFGLSSGSTWSELIEAYNPLSGNLWILVILSTLLSPILTYRLKWLYGK